MKKIVIISSVLLLLAFGAQRLEGVDFRDNVDSMNRFTFKMLLHLQEENNLYSPFSIFSSLGLVYGGARGETEKQLANVLDIEGRENEIHELLSHLLEELDKRNTEGITLRTANGLWLDREISIKRAFDSLSKSYYRAETKRLDLINQPVESSKKINSWISEKTDGKIDKIISPESIDSDTRMILTNCLYFSGRWAVVFDDMFTNDSYFLTSHDTAVKVPFMSQKSHYYLYSSDSFQAIEVPYVEEDLAMVIVLPEENLDLPSFLEAFCFDQYMMTIASFEKEEVELYIPLFRFEAEYYLNDFLKKMGLIDAFNESADFSGISGAKPGLFIDEIIHKSSINVMEQGTEAAAATIIRYYGATGIPPEPIIFYLNRPFLFFIRDRVTGTILFSGTLYNPDPEAEIVPVSDNESFNKPQIRYGTIEIKGFIAE